VDKTAIAQTTQARGSVDAGNPQATEITLAVTTITKSIEQRLEHSFIRSAKQDVLGAKLAFGKFEDLLVTPVSIYLWSRPRHDSFSFREGGSGNMRFALGACHVLKNRFAINYRNYKPYVH
jgi:hypothetical protein